MKYKIEILSDKDFESLPYPETEISYGIADPKTNTAYVRYTQSEEANKYLINHELEHLIEKSGDEHYRHGVYYKGFGNIFQGIGAAAQGAGQSIAGAAKSVGQGVSSVFSGFGGGNKPQTSMPKSGFSIKPDAMSGGLASQATSNPALRAPAGYATQQLLPSFSGETINPYKPQQSLMSKVNPTPTNPTMNQSQGIKATPSPKVSPSINLNMGGSQLNVPPIQPNSPLYKFTSAAQGAAQGAAQSAQAVNQNPIAMSGFGIKPDATRLTSPALNSGGTGGGNPNQIPTGNSLIKNPGQAALGAGLTAVGEFGKGYPKMPDLSSLPSVQALSQYKFDHVGQLDPALEEALNADLSRTEADELDHLKRSYKNLRPGADYETDSNFRKDILELQRMQGERRSEMLAKYRFDMIKTNLAISEQEMQQLQSVAQMEIDQIMGQFGMDYAAAANFKETFGGIGGRLMGAGMGLEQDSGGETGDLSQLMESFNQ